MSDNKKEPRDLVSVNENDDGTESAYIVSEGIAHINNDFNNPSKFISFVGAPGAGKSTTIGKITVLNESEYKFGVSKGFRPFTKGIQFTEQFKIENDEKNITLTTFCDVEGLESTDSSMRTMASAIILSDVIVYCYKGRIDATQKAVLTQALTTVKNIGWKPSFIFCQIIPSSEEYTRINQEEQEIVDDLKSYIKILSDYNVRIMAISDQKEYADRHQEDLSKLNVLLTSIKTIKSKITIRNKMGIFNESFNNFRLDGGVKIIDSLKPIIDDLVSEKIQELESLILAEIKNEFVTQRTQLGDHNVILSALRVETIIRATIISKEAELRDEIKQHLRNFGIKDDNKMVINKIDEEINGLKMKMLDLTYVERLRNEESSIRELALATLKTNAINRADAVRTRGNRRCENGHDHTDGVWCSQHNGTWFWYNKMDGEKICSHGRELSNFSRVICATCRVGLDVDLI